MAEETPRQTGNMVRRTGNRHQGRGLPPRPYERLILAGKPVDERTCAARLFRTIEDAIHGELGGRDGLTVAQLGLARRAATLSLQAELSERALIQGESVEMREYRATCAELRRVLEMLGLSSPSARGPSRQKQGYAAAIPENADGG